MRLTFLLFFILAVPPATTLAADPPGDEAGQPITIEWMVKEFPKYDDYLPRSVSWSPDGHLLTYLVANATEKPSLVSFDPARNATATILTPTSLGTLLDDLDENEEEVAKEPPAEEPRAVRIGRYEWSEGNTLRIHASGRVFLYDRGENSLDEIVLPEGQKKHLAYSPDGRFVAFTRDYDLYAYDFEQRREIRLTRGGDERLRNGELDWVYPEELGISSGFVWSPDSLSIAYLQFNEEGVTSYPITSFSAVVPETEERLYPKAGTRNPSVRVGVVRLSTQETRWIDLGSPYEYISRIEWQPDGNVLAIQALNRAQNHLALLFADPRDGSSEIILEERDDHWINVQDGPFWLEKSSDFLWLSERDGYRHLYRVKRGRKSMNQLTEGEWEVKRVLRVVESSNEVFFDATKASPTERHVYRVSLKGGRVRKITEEPGSHSASVSSDGLYLYDRFTNADTPTRRSVLTKKGKAVHVLGAMSLDDYSPYRYRAPRFFSITGDDGRIFHAKLITPAGFDPDQRYPVIFSVYGGPHGQVVRNQFGNMFSQVLATNGFLVFSIDNRGSWGRGHGWETPIHLRFGEIELADHLAGYEYLKSLAYVDADRIGIWGWSFGGYLTCYAMVKAPDVFKAGAAVAPVTNWRLYDTIYTERYMGHPDDNPEGYRDSSPIHFADELQGALLLAHGVSDDNVHIQNTYQMVDALLKANKKYEFYAYPQKSHGISGDEHSIHLYQRILDFFRGELQCE